MNSYEFTRNHADSQGILLVITQTIIREITSEITWIHALNHLILHFHTKTQGYWMEKVQCFDTKHISHAKTNSCCQQYFLATPFFSENLISLSLYELN